MFLLCVIPGNSRAVTDYTFGSEQVDYGITANQANRNVEDESYETLTETDSVSDTNFSATSENMVIGTAGGESFPSSLDTDDSLRRTYTEENTEESPPSNYELYIYPDDSTLTEWGIAVPGVAHYLNVDETTEGSDEGSTYVECNSDDDIDRFAMADISDPGTGYELDIQFFAVHYKGSQQGFGFQGGIYIGTTYYQGLDEGPVNGVYTNSSSPIWMINPATSTEWTYSELNVLQTYITSDDASPNVRCSQVGIRVLVNFTAVENYELDAEITFSSVTSTVNTIGYNVICQGYRDGTEDFEIYAWDYVGEGWNLKDAIDQSSDTNFNFDLTVNERDSGTDTVLLRILDEDKIGDSECQCVVSLDILKINRIDKYYRSTVIFTATGIPDTDISLITKGYTDDEESWIISLYNYTSTDWDTVFTVTGLSNAWNNETDLDKTYYYSTGEVKCKFENSGNPDKTTASEFYLDLLNIQAIDAPENYAPEITSSPILTGYYEVAYSYDVDATDDNPPDVLLYELYTNATFLSMDNDTGEISGTPDSYGWFWVTVEVYDQNVTGGNLSDTQDYDLTVWENFAPEITSSPVLTGCYEVAYSYDVDATDDNPPDVLLYELYTNATFLSMDNDTGEISGTPDSYGWFWVTVEVYDQNVTGGNLSDTQDYDLTVSVEDISEDLLTNAQIAIFVVIIGIICVILIIGVSEKK